MPTRLYGDCDNEHKHHGNAQSECSLYVLRNGKIGAHPEEVGEDHVVDENRSDEQI